MCVGERERETELLRKTTPACLEMNMDLRKNMDLRTDMDLRTNMGLRIHMGKIWVYINERWVQYG